MESIKKQIEFYFSDANLHKDKFMRQQIAANAQSMVPVATLAKFKRVESLSNDLATVIESIKMSAQLQLNDDETMVGRKEAFSLDSKYENSNKTLRVEGFPVEASLDEIMDFFQQLAPIACIRRQTDRATKAFSGIAWVDFEKDDDCKRVLETEGGLKYGDNALQMMLKSAFKEAQREDAVKKGSAAAQAGVEEVLEEVVFPSGHLLKIKFAASKDDGESSTANPMELKKFFTENYSKALFVESKTPQELVVRFENAVAQEIKDKLESADGSPAVLVGHSVESICVLDGDEELEQWRKIYADKKAAVGGKRGRDSKQGGRHKKQQRRR